MAIADVRAAFRWQAEHAAEALAPATARIVRAGLAVMAGETRLGRALAGWPRPSLEDALPLRMAAGFHHLFLTGDAPELGPVYAGALTDQHAVDARCSALAERFDTRLLDWLRGPPQTNEAGRGASIVAGLLWLAQHLGPRFDLTEIGASAGVNTMLDRYRFDLGGVAIGPADSPMRIVPEWRGPPPPAGPLTIAGIAGCDIAPVDLADPAAALRLKAYVWPDAGARMARLDTAIALAAERRPDLVQMDAGRFVAERLARPQQPGTTRALFHTVMWQYLPQATRAAITAAMERAGAQASAERPLAWLRLETNRATFRHELTVRWWGGPGSGAADWVQLGEAHPHGAWITWLAGR